MTTQNETGIRTISQIVADLRGGRITRQQALIQITALFFTQGPRTDPQLAVRQAEDFLRDFDAQGAVPPTPDTGALPPVPTFTPGAGAPGAPGPFGVGIPAIGRGRQESQFLPAVAPPTPRDIALETQRETDPGGVFSRVTQAIPGFGEFNPLVQRGIESRAGDAFARLRLAQVGNPTLGFEQFLGGGGFGRGDPDMLRNQLRNLQGFLGRSSDFDVGFQGAVRGAFDDPQNILQAILQPGLAAIAPSLRGSFARTTGTEFDRFQARQPESNLLNEFSRRGFF